MVTPPTILSSLVSWDYSNPQPQGFVPYTLPFGLQTRCVIKGAFIHISTSSFPGDVGRHNHFVEGSKQDVHHLRSFAFVHIPRVLNEAAHTLTKSAAASLCDDVWLEDIPACILDIVTREQQVPRS